MIEAPQQRIFGLDLLRALAAVIVVYSHADDLLDAHWPRDPGASALDGVDLFFVLSGFLIGGMLIRSGEATGIPLWRRILDFWQRRWLRTLPNYYLFLIINLALLYLGWAPGSLHVNVLAYFVFLQNLIVPLDLFFWESWSLAVEEWFYLLFPLLLAALAWQRWPKWTFLAATVLMISVPIALRYPAVESIDTPFMLGLLVRRVVVLRLDAIGYGVLMAWLFHYLPQILVRWRLLFFMIGLVTWSIAAWQYNKNELTYQGTTFLVLSCASMACLLPAMAGWQSGGRWMAVVGFMSRISFALYLVHMPVRALYLELMPGRSVELSLLLYAGYWILCIVLSALVYRYWELPFMALREGLSRKILVPNVPLKAGSP